MNFNRRKFFKSIGAAGLFLSPIIRLSRLEAATDVPKRFIGIFKGSGGYRGLPKATGSETNFTLGEILAPLEPYKKHLIVMDGVDLARDFCEAHWYGVTSFLTNAKMFKGDFRSPSACSGYGFASGMSLDQFLANEFGKSTAFKSLELGLENTGSSPINRISYAGADQPLPPDSSPQSVFNRVFARTLLGEQNSEEQKVQLEKIQIERRSVLDFVMKDLQSLTNQLSGSEKQKLDFHMESVREIEQRLANGSATTPTCQKPQSPSGSSRDEEKAKDQIDLLVNAMACDLTRVGTIMMTGGGTGELRLNSIGVNQGHHAVSHYNQNGTRDAFVRSLTWFSEQYAYLLERLSSIPEGNGSMLDNTVIFIGSDINDGDMHGNQDMPYLLAGNAGGFFKTGRYLKFNGIDHAGILVSIANAMGFNVSSFGNHSSQGAISELQG